MLWATVPETSIDKDGYARSNEGEIGRYVSYLGMFPVTKTGSPEMKAQA